MSKLNIAVCFFGLTRSLKYTIDSIEENIMNVLSENNIKCTKYIHTYDLEILTNRRSGENKCHLDLDEYKLLNCDHISITNQQDFLKSINFNIYKKGGDPWKDNFVSLRNLLCQLNSLMTVTRLWEKNNENDKYDLVLYIRPDLLYNKLCIDDIMMSFNEKCLLTPSFHLMGGFNDRIAMGPPNLILPYGLRFQYAEEYVNNKNALHAERFLKNTITKYEIKHKPVWKLIGKRVRANGIVYFRDVELFQPFHKKVPIKI